uniref:Uncharacterized protein n=1 Tax=Oryza glumipatula TaxID=40148 RepID=A0A0E0BV99_9ORYZ
MERCVEAVRMAAMARNRRRAMGENGGGSRPVVTCYSAAVIVAAKDEITRRIRGRARGERRRGAARLV